MNGKMLLRSMNVCLREKNYLWCLSYESTYLYRLDIRSGILDVVVPLLDETDLRWAFGGILRYKDWLVFLPCVADEVVLYHAENNTVKRIPVPQPQFYINDAEQKNKFFSGVIQEDFLYLFGCAYPGILKLDLREEKFSVFSEWINEFQQYRNNWHDGCFIKGVVRDNIVYLPFSNANAVMKFHLITEETNIVVLGDVKQRYISVEDDGKDLWLIPRESIDGCIVRWNPETGSVEEYRDYPPGFTKGECSFFNTVYQGGYVWLFAHRADMNIKVDVSDGKMYQAPDYYDASLIGGCRYPVVASWQRGFIILDSLESQWMYWDCDTEEVKVVPAELSQKIYEQFEEKELRKIELRHSNGQSILYRERKQFILERFLKRIKLENAAEDKEVPGNIGKRIYRILLEECE